MLDRIHTHAVQDMIEACAYGISEGLEHVDILKACKNAKLAKKECTESDLLRFMVRYTQEIRPLYRKINQIKALSGLTEVGKTLRERVQWSEQGIQVQACSAYLKYVNTLEHEEEGLYRKPNSEREREANPYKNDQEQKEKLMQLIEAAKKQNKIEARSAE